MATIKSKLNEAGTQGQRSENAVKRAVNNARVLASSAITNPRPTAAKERKNILTRYKYIFEQDMPQAKHWSGAGYKWDEEDRTAWIANRVYNEELAFYDTNARTSILKTMIKRVASKILDNYEVTDKDGNKVEYIEIEVGAAKTTLVLSHGTYTDAVRRLLLGGRVYLVAYVNDEGDLYFKVKDRYEVRANPTGYDILYTVDGKPHIERRHLNNEARGVIEVLKQDKKGDWVVIYDKETDLEAFDAFGVYPIEIDPFVTRGTLELVLMYSQLYGTINKEAVMGALQIFADKNYNTEALANLQDFFTPVATPNTSVSLEEGGKPLWEAYAPTLRDGSLNTLRDMLRDEIAASLMLDRGSLGLDSNGATATEETIKLSASVDTINMIKQEVAEVFTTYLIKLLEVGYTFVIKPYQVNDVTAKVDTANKALSGRLMSLPTAVKFIHPEWTADEVMAEVLAIKIENMAELTPAEEAQAIELGLLAEQEGAPTEDEPEEVVESGTTI